MNQVNNKNATFGISRIRVIRGGGWNILQRRKDREQFAELLIQLGFLTSRADRETAAYYHRNLIQQAERTLDKCQRPDAAVLQS